MSIKTSLLTIISVVAVAAAAFPSSNAEKLDADSAGSLAAVAETFTSFNQTAMASFPLSNAETDAMAAAFLPWLFLLRLKRRLVQHRDRKRNNSKSIKHRFFQKIVAGIGLGQSRRGVFARRFRGSIALFLASLLCVLPIQPTMTSQTVEFDEANQTVSVTFYDENLDANYRRDSDYGK